MKGVIARAIAVATALGSCASDPGGQAAEATSGTTGERTSTTGGPAPTGATDPATTSADTVGADESSTGGDPPPPPVTCAAATDDVAAGAPGEYGFATDPPTMALADTAYGYRVRTRASECVTDRVRWTLVAGPQDARLELGDGIALAVGDSLDHDAGGDPVQWGRVTWDLATAEPGCHAFELTWEAWLDCDDGNAGWGPLATQRWDVHVRENHWYSGDMHVHTRHSERGDEAGGVQAYYDRMVNAAGDDAGDDFSDRRLDSLRGRLHWLIFSDHTNNELEECGRHFATWCAEGEEAEVATGRDVVRALTEADPTTLLVVGSEISNQFDGHFGFLPKNPFPGHPIYAPGYEDAPTQYDHDAGFGPGIFRERWVDETATNAEEITLVHDMNGLAIVNHESAVAPWVEYDWTSLDFDGIEVWNGGNRHDQDDDHGYHGNMDLGEVTADNRLTVQMPEDPIVRSYIGMLKTGRWPLALVGGSDVHDSTEIVCGSFPCDPTNAQLASPATSVWAPTFVWANGSDGVGDGLAAGRVVVHDRSNFIDLRATVDGQEYLVGDTIDYFAGTEIELRAFGRVSDYIDGDNRVLLVLGTRVDVGDPVVDVLYNSEDDEHFVADKLGLDEARYLRPDASFDRVSSLTLSAAQFPASGTYVVWAQFLPWHNPLYAFGNGRDHALTGVIRLAVSK